MTIAEAVKKLWGILINKMLWQVFMLTVLVSACTIWGSYRFYFKDKMEKASGASIEEVADLNSKMVAVITKQKEENEKVAKAMDEASKERAEMRIQNANIEGKLDILINIMRKP